jgi:hypothetical protein
MAGEVTRREALQKLEEAEQLIRDLATSSPEEGASELVANRLNALANTVGACRTRLQDIARQLPHGDGH